MGGRCMLKLEISSVQVAHGTSCRPCSKIDDVDDLCSKIDSDGGED